MSLRTRSEYLYVSYSLYLLRVFNDMTVADDYARLLESYGYVPVASNDYNSSYYPKVVSGSDEEDVPMSALRGNWGRKTTKGARWHRRGKLAPWGAGLDEWEVRPSSSTNFLRGILSDDVLLINGAG